MTRHCEDIKRFQQKISNLTHALNDTDSVTESSTLREERRRVRKAYKVSKKQWEEDWWLEIVNEASEAARRGDTRKLYTTLKRIGIKDSSTIEDEHFTPQEYKAHFQKVSENRFERGVEEILVTAKNSNEDR